MNKNIVTEVQQLTLLGQECGVTVNEACRKVGIAPSTPHRWAKGNSGPTLTKITQLRCAILRIARERNTLPVKHLAEFEALAPEKTGGDQ